MLTSPAETGAVTLALPQDTQAEAFDYPEAFFDERDVEHRDGRAAIAASIDHAASAIRDSVSPLIIAGGGVLYSEATEALRRFAEARRHRRRRDAGRQERNCPGIIRSRSAPSASPDRSPPISAAREADLVIAVGTRLADFTTMSKTAFENPDVRFVAINVCEIDAFKHAALPVVADARVALEELTPLLTGFSTSSEYRNRLRRDVPSPGMPKSIA